MTFLLSEATTTPAIWKSITRLTQLCQRCDNMKISCYIPPPQRYHSMGSAPSTLFCSLVECSAKCPRLFTTDSKMHWNLLMFAGSSVQLRWKRPPKTKYSTKRGQKKYSGEYVEAGMILHRQLGLKVYPGENVSQHTMSCVFGE